MFTIIALLIPNTLGSNFFIPLYRHPAYGIPDNIEGGLGIPNISIWITFNELWQIPRASDNTNAFIRCSQQWRASGCFFFQNMELNLRDNRGVREGIAIWLPVHSSFFHSSTYDSNPMFHNKRCWNLTWHNGPFGSQLS